MDKVKTFLKEVGIPGSLAYVGVRVGAGISVGWKSKVAQALLGVGGAMGGVILSRALAGKAAAPGIAGKAG